MGGLPRRRQPFADERVAAAFERHPLTVRKALLRLRERIFEVARDEPRVGRLEETLRWGEPAYITHPRTGTTVRIDAKTSASYSMFVHCQTDLLSTFRSLYPEAFEYIGSREVRFAASREPAPGPLRHCIALALTYRLER